MKTRIVATCFVTLLVLFLACGCDPTPEELRAERRRLLIEEAREFPAKKAFYRWILAQAFEFEPEGYLSDYPWLLEDALVIFGVTREQAVADSIWDFDKLGWMYSQWQCMERWARSGSERPCDCLGFDPENIPWWKEK